MGRASVLLTCFLVLLSTAAPAYADQIRVAVASNFVATLESLLPEFEAQSGYRVVISAGSTGKLYHQIARGAPFDVFLAADESRPLRLEEEGLTLPDTRFTYAVGRLVLWSAREGLLTSGADDLRRGRYTRLAMANPVTAPYGSAARQVLEALGLWDAVQPKLVRGENITQTFQFVASGNAELGFVALAQVRQTGEGGSRWVVPESLHAPVRQQGVILKRAKDATGARALVIYLRSPDVQARLERAGYGVEP